MRRAGPITVAVGIADNFARIENWLLEEASTERQMIDLLVKLIRQMKAAGSSVDRLTLHIGTLHPQLVGFAWVWNTDDGFCDEVRVSDAAVDSDAYRLNPLQRIVETGETIRRRPSEPSARAEFPIMIELAAAGMTDYAAIPLSSLDTRNVITITTKVAGGFAEAEIDCLIRLFKLFALHVQRHSELKISENALGAYLGYGAAAKVLEGAIKRGAGDSVRAVIWDRTIRVASDAEGCHLLRAGIVLHEGAVFFGNVGAPDRPDFTVIGAAVNEACRVEALTKTIGRDLLMTEAVARHVPQDVEHLGEHQLRGISARMSVYGLAG